MRVFSFFENEGRLEPVEVELQLLPGLPQLRVIGLPDAHIKESGWRIKAALTAQAYQWPRGQQVVVNLRPSHIKKQSRGLELAMAVALIWETAQAECPWKTQDHAVYIYGELSLTGEVRCPEDVETTPAPDAILLLGRRKPPIEARHYEISQLGDLRRALDLHLDQAAEDWHRPDPPELVFGEVAARLLCVAGLSESSLLLAGPPGTGKTTWAEALHCLLPEPDKDIKEESRTLHAREGRRLAWRPFVNPHHTTPTKSMVGGGYPLFPGEIAKAHGGLLILDELLLFPTSVLEALREPMEAGRMRIARKGHMRVWPARFQVVATTNLCPCGRLTPGWSSGCSYSLKKCRSSWERLSGPMLDRFDILAFTHDWNSGSRSIPLRDILQRVEEARHGTDPDCSADIPSVLVDPNVSLRRRRAMARVAHALTRLDQSRAIESRHWLEAHRLCVEPQIKFQRLFG